MVRAAIARDRTAPVPRQTVIGWSSERCAVVAQREHVDVDHVAAQRPSGRFALGRTGYAVDQGSAESRAAGSALQRGANDLASGAVEVRAQGNGRQTMTVTDAVRLRRASWTER